MSFCCSIKCYALGLSLYFGSGFEDATYDSEEEADYSKMDMVSKNAMLVLIILCAQVIASLIL